MMKEAGVLSKKMEVRERDGGSEQRLESKEGLLGCPHRKRKGSFLLHGKERPGLIHMPHLFPNTFLVAPAGWQTLFQMLGRSCEHSNKSPIFLGFVCK